MIDKGEVDLDDETSSNATLEEAIGDAWNDIEEQEKKKNKPRSDLGDRESDYLIDSTQQDIFEGEESEEDYDESEGDIDESEEDTEESHKEEYFSSKADEASSKARESTVRSNDIALGFDEEDSEEDGDENENDEENEVVSDIDKRSLVKSNKSAAHRSNRNKNNRLHKIRRSASIRHLNESSRPTRGLRYSITDKKGTVIESISKLLDHILIYYFSENNMVNKDRKFIARDEGKNSDNKNKVKKKQLSEVSISGLQDKKVIERKLRGYELKKDKMKKIVQQKILQKKFKEDIKYREEQNKQNREKAREERHKDIKNQEKRLKLKSNILYHIYYSKRKQKG
jgi:hypothetical protein